MSERGQLGSATRHAAMLGLNDRLVEHSIQVVDQKPSTSIGHPDGPSRCRDRAVFAHGFEQSDFPMAD